LDRGSEDDKAQRIEKVKLALRGDEDIAALQALYADDAVVELCFPVNVALQVTFEKLASIGGQDGLRALVLGVGREAPGFVLPGNLLAGAHFQQFADTRPLTEALDEHKEAAIPGRLVQLGERNRLLIRLPPGFPDRLRELGGSL